MRRMMTAALAAAALTAWAAGGAGTAFAQAVGWADKPQADKPKADAASAPVKRYYVAVADASQMGMLDWETVHAGATAGRTFARVIFVYRQTPSTDPRNAYLFLTADVEFDCAGARWKTAAVASEDADYRELTTSTHDGDWRTVNPGSAAALFSDAACHPDDIDPALMMTASAPELRARFLRGEIKPPGEQI